MEQIINLCEFVVKKNYIKTVEDFAKIIEQEYKINPWDEGIGIKSLIIIKNYLTTVEFTKIINNFNKTSLSFITRMNLTANDLKEIPKELQHLTNLQALILNNNKIEVIDNLNGLVNLVHLELRTNKIKEFRNLSTLLNLSRLSLSCNCINSIEEEEVGMWQSMEEFGIFGNFLGDSADDENNKRILLSFITIIRTKMPNLKNLSIGGNNFSKLEDFVQIVRENLSHLKKIDGVTLLPNNK